MTKFAPVAAVVEKLVERNAARLARIEAAFSEANRGIEPTLDRAGRYHAPCNGYQLPFGWASQCEGDYEDRLFAAGEYLPVPIADEEHAYNRDCKIANLPNPYQQKVKALVEDILELRAMNIYRLEATHGKVWDDNGKATAYAYVSGLRSLVDASVACLTTLHSQSKSQANQPEVYLEGKQTVTGVIVATKIQHDDTYGPSVKMLVTTDTGCKLWGTMPRALPEDSKGRTVTFSATFAKGKDGMSYFKRPTCAQLVGA